MIHSFSSNFSTTKKSDKSSSSVSIQLKRNRSLDRIIDDNLSSVFLNELTVPIVKEDFLEDWLDVNTDSNNSSSLSSTSSSSFKDSSLVSRNDSKNELYNSLEDLVKTFDTNVKKCLVDYDDVDIGEIAPVQIRSQKDVINDSQ
jgi:hypothetical protein